MFYSKTSLTFCSFPSTPILSGTNWKGIIIKRKSMTRKLYVCNYSKMSLAELPYFLPHFYPTIWPRNHQKGRPSWRSSSTKLEFVLRQLWTIIWTDTIDTPNFCQNKNQMCATVVCVRESTKPILCSKWGHFDRAKLILEILLASWTFGTVEKRFRSFKF